ncbi:importin-7 [Periplaneta americana]|uniref:Importin-7 n=1 Tax=Periplaneta americana TaxID=6978 RepID=A0ABQ8S6H1_PERAM|nr:importin-7 [Periplaneta americana]
MPIWILRAKTCLTHISAIQASDPAWYQALTGNLTTEQQKALQEVMVLADQRKAAAESKRIEQSGGKYIKNNGQK